VTEMRQILLVMCLGRLAGLRSVGGKFTLQRRRAARLSLISTFADPPYGNGHVLRMKWVRQLSDTGEQGNLSWTSLLQEDFFSNLWDNIDLFNLHEWAKGLRQLQRIAELLHREQLHMVARGPGNDEESFLGKKYAHSLVSHVAGKLGMEAVQFAMLHELCKLPEAAARHVGDVSTDPFTRLQSTAGAAPFCTKATERINSMLQSVDDFADAALLKFPPGDTSASDGLFDARTLESAVGRLIYAICDLELIRGVILSDVAGVTPFDNPLRPPSSAVFANHETGLRQLLGRVAGEPICGEAASASWLKWLQAKTTSSDTFARFEEAQAAEAQRNPTQRLVSGDTATRGASTGS